MKPLIALFLKTSYICMNGHHIGSGAQKSEGIGTLWNWSYRVAMWVLGNKLESSTRIANALRHCTISLAAVPFILF